MCSDMLSAVMQTNYTQPTTSSTTLLLRTWLALPSLFWEGHLITFHIIIELFLKICLPTDPSASRHLLTLPPDFLYDSQVYETY